MKKAHKGVCLMTEKEIIEFNKSLSTYEFFVYFTIEYLKRKNESCTLEAIHTKSIEFLLKNRVKIEGKGDITKTLPKLATFDETTQEWNLKSKEQILQELKLKRKTKTKKSNNV